VRASHHERAMSAPGSPAIQAPTLDQVPVAQVIRRFRHLDMPGADELPLGARPEGRPPTRQACTPINAGGPPAGEGASSIVVLPYRFNGGRDEPSRGNIARTSRPGVRACSRSSRRRRRTFATRARWSLLKGTTCFCMVASATWVSRPRGSSSTSCVWRTVVWLSTGTSSRTRRPEHSPRAGIRCLARRSRPETTAGCAGLENVTCLPGCSTSDAVSRPSTSPRRRRPRRCCSVSRP
jgi:hypothetical protein